MIFNQLIVILLKHLNVSMGHDETIDIILIKPDIQTTVFTM